MYAVRKRRSLNWRSYYTYTAWIELAMAWTRCSTLPAALTQRQPRPLGREHHG